MHLLLGLPLNASLPRAAPLPPPDAATVAAVASQASWSSLRAALVLSLVFAATWFISTAMAAHLPRLFQAAGVSLAGAVLVGALIGPAQVGARLLGFGYLRKVHPLLSARLAAAMHPLGVAVLVLLGAPAAAAFGILHGAGNGILTIAKGTLPLVIFGTQGYGHRQGLLMVPARVLQAAAPWLFGLALDAWGKGALWVSATAGVLAFLALLIMATLRRSALPKTRRTSTTCSMQSVTVRPKAMTVAVILAGLFPILWGDGTGSEVMQRIAAPMVGGMITAPLLSMLVIPAAYLLMRRRARTAVATATPGSA